MSKPIEDYGFIGNMNTCALVGMDGSIDWLCLPRFDSDACFASLLGDPKHGRWLISPVDDCLSQTRRYLNGTAVLETKFKCHCGSISITDFLALTSEEQTLELIRIVRGLEGSVEMEMELILRLGYGLTIPWVRRRDYGIRAIAGPDAIDIVTPVGLRGEALKTVAEFTVAAGQVVPFTLAYHPSNKEPRFIDDRTVVLEKTVRWWQEWSKRCACPEGTPAAWREAVTRSAITLKALTFAPTGGILAAGTTSLPERIGGTRNWDYRFCWIRDATLTLYALINTGYFEEAEAFREWLLRAAAGHPQQMQIMYGLAGERRLTEVELPWLPGYEGSRPVRIGNLAHDQLQLDVYGELMDVMHAGQKGDLAPSSEGWNFQHALLDNLEKNWRKPDKGIWEVRTEAKQFTYSKVMAWVAFDRAIKSVERFGLRGPGDRWRKIRGDIHKEVMTHGFNKLRNTFVREFGGSELDAALLLIGSTGFVPANDPRFRGTVEAVERNLLESGFVLRYRRDQSSDGSADGSFLACSFWLADAYVQLERRNDAIELLERLLSVRNDLGLLSEQYETLSGRLLGNFPQAYSHVGIINTVHNLMQTKGPSAQRAD